MEISAPKPAGSYFQMFFNVEASVGHFGQNSNSDDILLVQFLLRKCAEISEIAANPERKARLMRVPLTSVCEENTIDGIRAIQEQMKEKNAGTVVDGRVSKARGHHYGGGAWTIVTLNASVRHEVPEHLASPSGLWRLSRHLSRSCAGDHVGPLRFAIAHHD